MALVKLGEIGQERAQEFLQHQAFLTVAWDEEMADQAALAFARFGRGRHVSSLNVGDCFSYALAERLKVPLLFIGDDFSQPHGSRGGTALSRTPAGTTRPIA